MTPSYSFKQEINSAWRYAISFSQRLHTEPGNIVTVGPADFAHVVIAKLRTSMGFPMAHSAFGRGILSVVRVISQKQMIWVAAWRIITAMQNARPEGISSVGNTESQAASDESVLTATLKQTISCLVSIRDPLPAVFRVSNFYLGPKGKNPLGSHLQREWVRIVYRHISPSSGSVSGLRKVRANRGPFILQQT